MKDAMAPPEAAAAGASSSGPTGGAALPGVRAGLLPAEPALEPTLALALATSSEEFEEETMAGLALVELTESLLTPIDENETLTEFEERLAQGMASALPEEAEEVQRVALQLLQEAHFFLETIKMGLAAPQVRMLLKGMAAKVREVPLALSNRYLAALAVYRRLGGARDESLFTKARRLLLAAGEPVPQDLEGDEVSLSGSGQSGSPGRTPGRTDFHSLEAGGEERRNFTIATPTPMGNERPFLGFSTPRIGMASAKLNRGIQTWQHWSRSSASLGSRRPCRERPNMRRG